MINGGPAANYYAGPGDGSEYSTTVINCLFEFVKIECTEAYKIYFEVLKMLCFTFLGLPPLVPSIVGSDRAKAIVNAALLVWPDTRCVLCWIHVYIYLVSGKFAKYMSSACTAETRARIEADITALHYARNQEMFGFLLECMLKVWTREGEQTFAAYFKRYYGTGVWSRWHCSAIQQPGVKADQNPQETRHKNQKALLGKGLLKATPYVMANVSAPLIVASEGASNAEEKKWPSVLQPVPRLSGTVAAKARKLGNLRSIKVRIIARLFPFPITRI